MFRFWRHALFFCLLLALLAASGQHPTPVAAQSSAGEVLQLVNSLRASYGLPPFSQSSVLAVAAQSHANWMASTGLYSHTGAGGSSPQSRSAAAGYPGYVAENIVGGTNLTAQQGVTWWINSPIHFNTLISPRYTEVGIGVATGLGQNFYVLVAGTTSDSPPAVAAGTGTAARGENEIFVVAALDLAEPREDGSIVHTVQSGQSLWSIAARYGVPLQDVLLFNSLSEDSTINPGDEVTIRLADGAEPPPPPTTYIVRSGDNAWTIAARFRLTLEDFLWYNSMSEDSLIQPSDVVKIGLAEGEAPPPTPTPQLAHVVRSGETLWDISLRYGLTVAQLLTLNGLSENAVLSVGQEVYIRETPQPVPTETPFPPTFTPVPPSAGPAEVVIVANPNGPTATPTTTPLALAANVADGPATPRPGGQAEIQNAALATSSAPGWMIAAGVGTFALALLLMVGVIVLAVRKL